MNSEQKYVFKSISLKTSKLSEQFHFYIEKLGFSVNFQNDKSFGINCGQTLLIFEESDNNSFYHFAFNIPENQMNEALAWIKKYASIIPFEKKEIVDFPNWNAHSLYFKDPSGNVLEFIARHNLNNKESKAFNAKSITEISEIGIPTNDLSGVYKKLKQNLSFELYWGDLEKFAAIGHEKCLFITVPIEREWFPTQDVISKIWPLKVEISNGIKTKTIKQVKSDYIFLK